MRRGLGGAWTLALLCLLRAAPTTAQEPAEPSPPEEQAQQEFQEAPPSESEQEGEGEQQAAEGEEEPPAGEPSLEQGQPRPPGPSSERIQFQLPFPAEKGGGTVSGGADSLEFLHDTYAVLEGSVTAEFRNQSISAQRVEVDLETMVVTAVGNVVMDEGPNRLTGESMVWDMETNTGTLSEATAYMAPDMYFRGKTVERVGEDTYSVTKGQFSSCPADVPLWSFGVGKAKVRVEGYARGKNVTMKSKKVPFLYIPYFLYPAKRQRTSGFMMPDFGYSENRGYSLGLAYFQTLGDSYDTTFFLDAFTEDFVGVGNEIRYAPKDGTKGEIQSYFVDDPESPDLRWRVFWNHLSQDLPLGLRAAVNYTNFSDFDFFRDFDRDLNRITIRTLYSSAYLAGSWGAHSFNMLVDDREVLSKGVLKNLTQNQLPEIEYRLRQTQLGGLPLYMQLVSGLHYFNIQRGASLVEGEEGEEDDELIGRLDNQYGRFYLFPTFTLPFGSLPWLNVNLSLTGRYTRYTDSNDLESPGELSGEPLDRLLPAAGAQIVGPSFSRVFDKGMGRFTKFKHLIEPRWGYQFSEAFDRQSEVPLFDEVDRQRGLHFGAFTLGNKLIAKGEEDPENPFASAAREIMSFDISQSYSFDKDQPLERSLDGEIKKQSSPIGVRYRWNPSLATSLQTFSSYSNIYSRWTQHSVSGQFYFGGPNPNEGAQNPFSTGRDRHNIGLSWGLRFRPDTGETRSNQVGLASGFNVGRFLLQASVNLDLAPKGMSERPTLQQQRYLIQRAGTCLTWLVELRQYQTATFEDRDIRFSISLKNIGTFLDLGTGSGNSQYQRGKSYSF